MQEAVSCGNNVNCQVPITGNKTFHDIQLQNGSIPYELTLPSLKETTYWISGVVNMGWCRLNSLKTSDLVHEGDYHTTSNEEFYVNQQNNLVQKDLVAELVTIAEIGTFYFAVMYFSTMYHFVLLFLSNDVIQCVN